VLSQRAVTTSDAFRVVVDFILASRYGDRRGDPRIADFTFGNPQEMPLPGLVAAIREQAIPQNKDWYAYKTSEEEPQAFLAEAVSRELGLPFEPPDIALTAGAFAAISVAFRGQLQRDLDEGELRSELVRIFRVRVPDDAPADRGDRERDDGDAAQRVG